MNEELIRELMSKEALSLDEIKEILDYIVANIRKKMDINDTSTRLCKECSIVVWNLCDKLNIPYIPISMSDLGMQELEHHFGIVGFKSEYGQICYLIDLTYIQFDVKKYPINSKELKTTMLVSSPTVFTEDEVKNNLLQSGYLVLSEENFENYIGGFIESYMLVNSIDARNVYDDAYELLSKYSINLIDEDELNNNRRNY